MWLWQWKFLHVSQTHSRICKWHWSRTHPHTQAASLILQQQNLVFLSPVLCSWWTCKIIGTMKHLQYILTTPPAPHPPRKILSLSQVRTAPQLLVLTSGPVWVNACCTSHRKSLAKKKGCNGSLSKVVSAMMLNCQLLPEITQMLNHSFCFKGRIKFHDVAKYNGTLTYCTHLA